MALYFDKLHLASSDTKTNTNTHFVTSDTYPLENANKLIGHRIYFGYRELLIVVKSICS